MTDDSRPTELHPNRDPSGRPPQPDGDRMVAEPTPNIAPATTRQKLLTAVAVVAAITAIAIELFR